MLNAVTVDVEEYFHPTEVQTSMDRSRWAALPSRIEKQLDQILELSGHEGHESYLFRVGVGGGAKSERNPKDCQCGT